MVTPTFSQKKHYFFIQNLIFQLVYINISKRTNSYKIFAIFGSLSAINGMVNGNCRVININLKKNTFYKIN